MRSVEGDWNETVSRNNRKKGDLCRSVDGHVKEPYEMPIAWQTDRRSNYFSPPAYISTVIYINEISLNVTLINQSTPPLIIVPLS